MTSVINKNAELKEFLLSKITDVNVVNMIDGLIMDYSKFVVGNSYKVERLCGWGKIKKTSHIEIVKKTKTQVLFKFRPEKCVMMAVNNATEACDNLPVKCSNCKKRLANKTFRKKIFLESDVEYIKCDAEGISKDFNRVFANKIV